MRLSAFRRASFVALALIPFVAATEVTAFARPLAVSPTPPPSLVLVLDAPAEAPAGTSASDGITVVPDLPIRPPAQRTGAIGKLTLIMLALVGLVVLAALVIVAIILFDLTSDKI